MSAFPKGAPEAQWGAAVVPPSLKRAGKGAVQRAVVDVVGGHVVRFIRPRTSPNH
jgi:hypothetical protein